MGSRNRSQKIQKKIFFAKWKWSKILWHEGRIRWRRGRWTWSTSLSMDTSGIHLQTQKCMQKISWEQTAVTDQGKRIYRTMQKHGRTKKLGKKTNVTKTGPVLGGWGNWSRGQIPTSGQLSESEEKHSRLRVKQLICVSLNGMRIRQSSLQPYELWRGMQVPSKAQWLGDGV